MEFRPTLFTIAIVLTIAILTIAVIRLPDQVFPNISVFVAIGVMILSVVAMSMWRDVRPFGIPLLLLAWAYVLIAYLKASIP